MQCLFRGTMQLAWKIRRQVDKVEVTVPGEKSDQNRLDSVLPRTRVVVVADGDDEDVRSKGVLAILLDRTPERDRG